MLSWPGVTLRLQSTWLQWGVATSLLHHLKGQDSYIKPRPAGGPVPRRRPISNNGRHGVDVMPTKVHGTCRCGDQSRSVWTPWRRTRDLALLSGTGAYLRDGSASCYVYWRYTGLAPPQDTFSIRPGGITISSGDVTASTHHADTCRCPAAPALFLLQWYSHLMSTIIYSTIYLLSAYSKNCDLIKNT